MRHLVGMKNIQMYEFTGPNLAGVLSECAAFVSTKVGWTWDLKQEWRMNEETWNGEFIITLFGCDA